VLCSVLSRRVIAHYWHILSPIRADIAVSTGISARNSSHFPSCALSQARGREGSFQELSMGAWMVFKDQQKFRGLEPYGNTSRALSYPSFYLSCSCSLTVSVSKFAGWLSADTRSRYAACVPNYPDAASSSDSGVVDKISKMRTNAGILNTSNSRDSILRRNQPNTLGVFLQEFSEEKRRTESPGFCEDQRAVRGDSQAL